MPPSQPLLSEQAAFAKHLFIQGYPLWNPDPDLLPRARQSVGLKIGDVGTVDERGRFDFFFNILESLPGSVGSTPNFPPIEDDVRCGGEDILLRGVISSPQTPWEVDQLEVLDVAGITRRTTEYGATLSEDGAHIILPQGAQSFELGLHHRRLFENHAREHGADWLERFRDRLGWPRSNSLYLLTGLYKTCSWSIASFSMQTAANTNPVHVRCTLVEVDERTIREASVWQPAGRFHYKIGPPPDRQGQSNQTIFIRGITVTPNLSKQGPSEQRETGLLSRIFSSTWFINPLAEDSTKATATETPESSVIIQHVPQISQASHPSEIINQYLLRKEPSAKIAVTHDSQWLAMLKLREGGQSWTLEDLQNRLEALVPVHYSIVTHNGTVYLRDKDDGPLTHVGVDRPDGLHLPGDLASEITSDRKPNAHGSSANIERITDPRVLSDELRVTDESLSHAMDSGPDRASLRSVSDQVVSPPTKRKIMTSYLRRIFGGYSSDSSPSREQSSRSQCPSHSRTTPNYVYAAPGASSGGPTSPPPLKTKRSNSYSSPITSPSPLRYNAFDTGTQASSSSGKVRYGTSSKVEQSPLYRRASYKSSEHSAHYTIPHTPSMTPSMPSMSFGPSSQSDSSSSLLPRSLPGSPVGSSSPHVRYERQPSLRHDPAWQGNMSPAIGSVHFDAGSPEPKIPYRPTPLHMHPLFVSTRLHSAPISYDITYTPSSRTVLDRTTNTAVPAHMLSQPATDPPTPANSRLVLRSDEFPWPVIVGPSALSPSGTGFHAGRSSSRSSRSSNITNLDLLYSLHATLLTRVTPQEWEALGHGSRAQRKVTRAYEKRCAKMGGGWEGGVRRLDWLHGKTRLIGIEVEKHHNGKGTGKLVFGKA